MSVRIRDLRGADLLTVIAIERQAFPGDPWTLATARGWLARGPLARLGQGAVLAWMIRLTRLNQALAAAKMIRLLAWKHPRGLRYIVAEQDRSVIGYACMLAVPAGEADVQMIALRSGCRGRGTGTAMLAGLISAASEQGCCAVTLLVRADNPRARTFYRRAGFAEAGELPGFYQPSGTAAVMMRRPLAAVHAPRQAPPEAAPSRKA